MPRKLTTDEFTEKARTVHGGRYDYSSVEYVKAIEKVTIICREHGATEWFDLEEEEVCTLISEILGAPVK